jgi:hypothetical protein
MQLLTKKEPGKPAGLFRFVQSSLLVEQVARVDKIVAAAQHDHRTASPQYGNK